MSSPSPLGPKDKRFQNRPDGGIFRFSMGPGSGFQASGDDLDCFSLPTWWARKQRAPVPDPDRI